MFTKKQLKIELTKQLAKALVFIIVVFVAIYAFSGKIAKIGQTAKQNRTAIVILGNKKESATQLKNDLIMIGNGDEKIEEAFIKVENIVSFVNQLEKIAQTNHLEQTLRFGNPVPLPNDQTLNEGENNTPKTFKLSKIEYDISLGGGSLAFNRYLEEFEKLPYFTNISSITVLSSPTPSLEGQSSISIKAQLYVTQ